MSFSIVANFDNASIGKYHFKDNKFHFWLKKEFKFNSHWFYFKIVDNPFSSLTFVIENINSSFYPKSWFYYRPFFSKDNISWQQIGHSWLKNHKFFFTIDNLPKEFYLARHIPYSLSRYYQWLAVLKKEKFFKIHHKKTLDILQVGFNLEGSVIIVARQHPGESLTSFFIEGVTDELKENKEFLERFKFLIFPLINKESVSLGYHRLDLEGNDYNRLWNTKKIQNIQIIKEQIKSISNLRLFFDIHSDETSKINYARFNSKESMKFLFLLKESSKNFIPLKSSSSKLIRIIKTILKKQPFFKGETAEEWVKKHTSSLSFTYEISDHLNDDKSAYELGRGLVKAIIKFLK